MTVEAHSPPCPVGGAALAREEGLARQLSTRQMAMIAIGGAIGTGLFLGSSLAIRAAGPAVILSYVLGAVIAVLLMGSLSEMAVAHPVAGSFGLYAELYASRWAGFSVRYTYWAGQCIAMGGEATAAAIYCRWWLPQVPAWAWILAFSAGLILVNLWGVKRFGEFEYWFAMIKVAAIVLFIAFGAFILVHLGARTAIQLRNYTAEGGFFPHGALGAWKALAFAIFSYVGTEVVAVTAGEAKDPEVAIPKAMRSMVARLVLFYLGAMVVLVGVVPWSRIQPTPDITASPFVRVFQIMRIPAATHLMNFVVLTAALSSMNTNLYLCTRMLFSLARGGFAPQAMGRVSPQGVPVPALLLSSLGLMAAATIAALYPGSAYVYLFGIAMFSGLFVWGMIFVTHLFFRRAWSARGGKRLKLRMIGYPYTSLLGLGLLLGILVTTWWVPGLRLTLLVGLPWLAVISFLYWLWERKKKPAGAR